MHIFIPRPFTRVWITTAAVVALFATTVQSAHACISYCIEHYGNLTQVAPNVWWELSHCSQTETMSGPVYITCYYHEYDFSHVPPG